MSIACVRLVSTSQRVCSADMELIRGRTKRDPSRRKHPVWLGFTRWGNSAAKRSARGLCLYIGDYAYYFCIVLKGDRS